MAICRFSSICQCWDGTCETKSLSGRYPKCTATFRRWPYCVGHGEPDPTNKFEIWKAVLTALGRISHL